MTPGTLDIIIPGAIGIVGVIGIIVLSATGQPPNDTLNTLVGVFATWAFGSGIYKTVTTIQNGKDDTPTKSPEPPNVTTDETSKT